MSLQIHRSLQWARWPNARVSTPRSSAWSSRLSLFVSYFLNSCFICGAEKSVNRLQGHSEGQTRCRIRLTLSSSNFASFVLASRSRWAFPSAGWKLFGFFLASFFCLCACTAMAAIARGIAELGRDLDPLDSNERFTPVETRLPPIVRETTSWAAVLGS